MFSEFIINKITEHRSKNNILSKNKYSTKVTPVSIFKLTEISFEKLVKGITPVKKIHEKLRIPKKQATLRNRKLRDSLSFLNLFFRLENVVAIIRKPVIPKIVQKILVNKVELLYTLNKEKPDLFSLANSILIEVTIKNSEQIK